MNYLIVALLVIIAAGTTFGKNIIDVARKEIVSAREGDGRSRNTVIEQYKQEKLNELAMLSKRVDAIQQRDSCLRDANAVRRANPDDASLSSVDRFCN